MDRRVLYGVVFVLFLIGSLGIYSLCLDRDNPEINSIVCDHKMSSRDEQTFIINVTDNLEIESVVAMIIAPDGSTIFSEEASLIDGFYLVHFDAATFIGNAGFQEGNYTFRVKALDEAGNSDLFSVIISIMYTLQDSFLKWAQECGFPLNTAQNFWDNYVDVVEYNFVSKSDRSCLERSLELEQKNPELNAEVYELSTSDKTFQNMTAIEIYNTIVKEVFRLNYIKYDLGLPRRTINMVGNVSCYVRQRDVSIPLVDLVWRLGNFSLDNELNFPVSREYYSAICLIEKISGVEQHANLLRGSCEQIEHIIYGKDLHMVKGESYVMNQFAVPAIEYIMRLINDGIFDINGLNDEEAGRLALPIELMEVTILDIDRLPKKTSYRQEWLSGTQAEHLRIGVNNVNPHESLGDKSPQEWLGETVWAIYLEKGDRYEYAIRKGINTLTDDWSLSLNHYQKIASSLVNEDNVSVFIQGCGGVVVNASDEIEPTVIVSEANIPYYSTLVGRVMGRPVKIFIAPNPRDSPGKHMESSTKTTDETYPYIGLFCMDTRLFLSDYNNSLTTPWLDEKQRDGTWVHVVWIKH